MARASPFRDGDGADWSRVYSSLPLTHFCIRVKSELKKSHIWRSQEIIESTFIVIMCTNFVCEGIFKKDREQDNLVRILGDKFGLGFFVVLRTQTNPKYGRCQFAISIQPFLVANKQGIEVSILHHQLELRVLCNRMAKLCQFICGNDLK